MSREVEVEAVAVAQSARVTDDAAWVTTRAGWESTCPDVVASWVARQIMRHNVRGEARPRLQVTLEEDVSGPVPRLYVTSWRPLDDVEPWVDPVEWWAPVLLREGGRLP